MPKLWPRHGPALGRRTRGPLRGKQPRRPNARVQVAHGPSRARRVLGALGFVLPRLAAVAVLVGGALGAVGLVQRAVHHPALAVRALHVSGTERLAEAEVRALCGDLVGTPLLTVDLPALVARVRESPWVAAVHVRRTLPGALTVRVVEHRPRLWVSLGRLYVAGDTGALFMPFAAQAGLDLPLLTGLSEGAEGDAPSPQVATRIREAIALSAALGPPPDRPEGAPRPALPLGVLQEIHWQEETGWSIVTLMGPHLSRVHLGFSPQARIQAAAEAVRTLPEGPARVRTIWADGVKNPRRVAVELVASEASQGRRPSLPPSRRG